MADARRPARQHQLHDRPAGRHGHVPARARAADAEVHRDLRRRPHRRAARTRSRVACRRSSPTARRASSRRTTAPQVWLYDGEEIPNVGFNAVVGRPGRASTASSPRRFDEMRQGAWDIDARIRDMDLNGVYASLCFPSFLPGFAGQRIQVGARPRARARHRAGLERLAPRGVGRARTRAASSRASCRTSSTPRSRPTRCAATPSAASRRSRSPRCRTSSGCRRCTPATGIRSCGPATRPARS